MVTISALCRNLIVMFEEEPNTGPVEVSRSLTDAMERAGFHPSQVYAVRECGFVLTDANAAVLSTDQRTRWSDAVRRWFAQNAG